MGLLVRSLLGMNRTSSYAALLAPNAPAKSGIVRSSVPSRTQYPTFCPESQLKLFRLCEQLVRDRDLPPHLPRAEAELSRSG